MVSSTGATLGWVTQRAACSAGDRPTTSVAASPSPARARTSPRVDAVPWLKPLSSACEAVITSSRPAGAPSTESEESTIAAASDGSRPRASAVASNSARTAASVFMVSGIGSAAPMLPPGAIAITLPAIAIRAAALQARVLTWVMTGIREDSKESRMARAASTLPPVLSISSSSACASVPARSTTRARNLARPRSMVPRTWQTRTGCDAASAWQSDTNCIVKPNHSAKTAMPVKAMDDRL